MILHIDLFHNTPLCWNLMHTCPVSCLAFMCASFIDVFTERSTFQLQVYSWIMWTVLGFTPSSFKFSSSVESSSSSLSSIRLPSHTPSSDVTSSPLASTELPRSRRSSLESKPFRKSSVDSLESPSTTYKGNVIFV